MGEIALGSAAVPSTAGLGLWNGCFTIVMGRWQYHYIVCDAFQVFSPRSVTRICNVFSVKFAKKTVNTSFFPNPPLKVENDK
jgi:hypothetical protein